MNWEWIPSTRTLTWLAVMLVVALVHERIGWTAARNADGHMFSGVRENFVRIQQEKNHGFIADSQ